LDQGDPYRVSGTITETHLAGATLNDQPVTLAPGSAAGTYSFTAALPLSYGAGEIGGQTLSID
jgi:hypothetical protein